MRHFRLPGTVAALARGVGMATAQTRLIALPGFTRAMGTRLARTLAGAVALAAVAGAADEHRYAAAGAEVASSWRFHRHKKPMSTRQDRAIREILCTQRRPPGHGARHR